MRICFVIGAMNYSGAEKVLSIVMGELAKKGNEVAVILLEQPYEVRETVDSIKTFGAKATGNRISRLLKRWKYIEKNVHEIEPDIVVSFGSVCNVNTIMSLLKSDIPLVVCERNDPVFDPRTKKERLERDILYRFEDAYVFQTNTIADYFKSICGEKPVGIIPNPIIDSGVRWDINNHKKVISTVARLDDFQKSHYKMMKAFELFHAKNPEYCLEIFGDGPDKVGYQEYIHDNGLSDYIILKGKTTNPQRAIANSSVFILTSKFEGMPNALMEAMSIGIPCVTTDCGGGGAYALFDMCGIEKYLLEKSTPEGIANALCNLVNDSQAQFELSSNSLRINEVLEKGKVARRWQEFLSKVVETQAK